MDNSEHLSLPVFEGSALKNEKAGTHIAGVMILATLAGVLLGYILAKHQNLSNSLQAKKQEAEAGPFVQTAQAKLGSDQRRIRQLAETLPYASVTLYAKVSGYLADILVDKGDRVKKGQLLATIYSPETTSQFVSAVADERDKRIRAQRARELFKAGDVTEEEKDRSVAAADMAQAKLEELTAQKGYTAITAPFDGTITARFADPGALVQDAERARSGALPVVTVSHTEKLRVTTFLNQADAPLVRVGSPAVITLTERPGVTYEARVTRKAGELDSRSRTMLTEIELENPNEEIVPGAFVDVSLRVKTPPMIQIPSQAVVMKGTTPYVALVSSDHSVHYRQVQAGANEGSMVNILSGLKEDETVIINAGNSLLEGQHVQISNDLEG